MRHAPKSVAPFFLALIAAAFAVGCAVESDDPLGATAQGIVGGTPAVEYPESVVLKAPNGVGCSGTVIAPLVVLTAGHCLVSGGVSWNVSAPYAGAQTAQTTGGVTPYNDAGNPKYVNYSSHDVALLFLDRPIRVGYPVLTREVFPSGYGLVNVGASVNGVSMGKPLRGTPIASYNSPNFFYWWTSNNQAQLEAGDSGGATYVPGTHILVGVNSGGRPGSDQVMARTDQVIDWLYEQMEIRGLQPSARPAPPWSACPGGNCKRDLLNTNEVLAVGQRLASSDMKTELVVQGDGNLVLYYNGVALWSSRTSGRGADMLAMQGDGNLALYSGGAATWWADTRGSDLRLAVQGDCNVVVYDSANNARWTTNTSGCVNRLFD